MDAVLQRAVDTTIIYTFLNYGFLRDRRPHKPFMIYFRRYSDDSPSIKLQQYNPDFPFLELDFLGLIVRMVPCG